MTSTGGSGLVVQVGTFTVHANAESLVNTLRKKGFTATAQKMTTAKGEMTRVIVGGKDLNRSAAATLQKKLETSMNLKGYIVSHSPSATTENKTKTKSSTKSSKAPAATNEGEVTVPGDGN